MTTFTTNTPACDLARLVERHGARRVLAAFLALMFASRRKRQRMRLDETTLSDHVRADIGLPPASFTHERPCPVPLPRV